MERFGDSTRPIRVKELVQVTHIVAIVDEENEDGVVEKELILSSNRRPIPIPYSEEP